MKKFIVLALVALVTSSASASVAPYTLHSISLSYLREIERYTEKACSCETLECFDYERTVGRSKAELIARKKLQKASKHDTLPSALRRYIEGGIDRSFWDHVAAFYPAHVEALRAQERSCGARISRE